ncbi:MAG TPA: FecR domain-containing protein [Caulobacteraceae bacterium]
MRDAADWFALKRSGAMTAAELVEFQAWLEASEDNRAAFAEAEESWAMAGLLREDPELMLLRAQARRSYPAFRRPLMALGGGVAAALIAAAVVTVPPKAPGHAVIASLNQEQTFKTGIGQRTTVTLADGSVVTLDTDTVLRTDDRGRERRMYLDKGRAFFRVAKDPTRPFVVTAAGRTVTALGTAFDVRVDGGFEVTLVEGKVRVEQPGAILRPRQSADLKAGYRIEAVSERQWAVEPANPARDVGWVQGRLTFVDQPLAEVAAEMNRYSEKKIVLEDEAVGRQTVVAVLKPGDLDAFIKMVRGYDLAQVTETETTVELTPKVNE